MPLYDFECQECGSIHEAIEPMDVKHRPCPVPDCRGRAKKIISASGVFCANDDAAWIRSVREVVNKDGGAHCQAFLKDPTRANWKAWMKGEGLRPFEPGERQRPEPIDEGLLAKKVLERHRKRCTIEVRS
jgi:putative FmdB family regulatory protein